MRERIIAALPYSLTASQRQCAVTDIVADLAQPNRMLRLFHGDVGSGKTVVALLARDDRDRGRAPGSADGADGNPGAAALRDIAPLAAKAGMRLALLTGRERGKERPAISRRACRRRYRLVVGTHALF